ncbi:MAG: hypothetical protein HKO66_00435 [Saprospiraceae bacterium]|nr:hypothetical protein [Bacteroidia bacterium]NNL90673.1 hypothetical protein [Saprospiraceae bacterium]
MKLRIKSNSIRLRLTKTEVGQLVKEGIVSDYFIIGGNRFEYTLKSHNALKFSAELKDNHLIILMPSEKISGWDINDKVGFETTLENDLYILIEKDFKCLTERKHEIEDDMYQNPRSSH